MRFCLIQDAGLGWLASDLDWLREFGAAVRKRDGSHAVGWERSSSCQWLHVAESSKGIWGPGLAKFAHDNFEDHQEIEGSSNRGFGLTVGGILVAIGLVRWAFFEAGQTSTIAFTLPGALLIVFGLLRPGLLTPLNRMWMKLGLLLASIVNPIVMALMYAVLFVPIGLGMKLFGRDALRMKRRSDASTNWIERDPAGPAPETMKNQF